VAKDNAVERGTRRADPFAALDDGERSALLEIKPQALGGEDKDSPIRFRLR
jgi:hypothetical protein